MDTTTYRVEAKCTGRNPACRRARKAGRPVHLIPRTIKGRPSLVLPDYHFATVDEALTAFAVADATAPVVVVDDDLYRHRAGGVAYKLPEGWVDPTRRPSASGHLDTEAVMSVVDETRQVVFAEQMADAFTESGADYVEVTSFADDGMLTRDPIAHTVRTTIRVPAGCHGATKAEALAAWDTTVAEYVARLLPVDVVACDRCDGHGHLLPDHVSEAGQPTRAEDGVTAGAEEWAAGDVVLAADGGLWVRAAAHDIEQGWPWAYCHGYAPQTGKTPPPEGAVPEDHPVRPLVLLLRDGHPVGGAR